MKVQILFYNYNVHSKSEFFFTRNLNKNEMNSNSNWMLDEIFLNILHKFIIELEFNFYIALTE